ncbi:sla2 Src-like adaptor 2 [Tieghemiomyces parasiticus]|uniref:Sla2 Src-like adaptor 2 n=1 Tax=Tieghemiomyces parasiticus TaxID=78921 RepID=A0A9W8DNX6_9FUNG|nr:sla2 Src-like adaptor 2 [Tieghemiomyces parasiticus]
MNSGAFSLRAVDREKAERDLAQHIAKACNEVETAPKQKHVRAMILYTWDYKSSVSIWSGLKAQPLLADEVKCFKALICIHKVIRTGHPVAIKEAVREMPFLETLGRQAMNDGWRGYGNLIRGYINFLLAKLEYHRLHPEFRGDFDYDDFTSLKETNDPNEGYETISDLLSLQDRLDQFQKHVFKGFRSTSNNECRISSLVPLVEESYGIYMFATRMLIAMHKRVDMTDALEPLRGRFNTQHYNLRRFYYECSNLRYLTSLITVPKLPQDPPNLFGEDDESQAVVVRPREAPSPQPKSPPPPAPAVDSDLIAQQEAELLRLQREEQQRQLLLQQQMEAERLQQQHEYEEQQRLLMEQQRMAQEQLLQQQMQQQVQGRLAELERELLNYRGQHERDQMTIAQYDKRVKALEEQLMQFNLSSQQRDQAKDDMIRALQDQVNMWKQKYEALAKMYAELRREHLALLNRFKEVSLRANSAADAAARMEKMQKDMRAKNLELADMIRERDGAQNELTRFRESQEEELERLRRDLAESNARVNELGRNKGAEVESLLAQFSLEKDELNAELSARQHEMEELRRQLDQLRADADRERRRKEEEIAVLQAGMDQSLMALAELQDSTHGAESDLERRLQSAQLEHASKLRKILDSVLQTCVSKVDESVFELQSSAHLGNQTATPEYALAMVEKAATASQDFMGAFNRHLNSGDDHTNVIYTATDLAQAISQLLINTKGVSRLGTDEVADDLGQAAHGTALCARRFFVNLQSFQLERIMSSQRPDVARRSNAELQESLGKVTALTESLVAKDGQHASVTAANGDIGDLVERAMLDASQAITDATARLASLSARSPDPNISAGDLKVHAAILESAMAMMNAIAQLIKCATASQQEIVAQGRGTSSTHAFYKKNNRWTEGLISAARAVAWATRLLVDTADGVIQKTHSFEQLIVASNEVAAATAQLVAASRVKSQQYSKTQERLELAAKAVTEAAKNLVKAVKAIAARQLEEQDRKVNYEELSNTEFKTKEMEQQVEIQKLDKQLTLARRRLGEMRRFGYHTDETN